MRVVLHARVDQVLYVGAMTWSGRHAGQCWTRFGAWLVLAK
jgi:hypothetical protein